MIRVERISNVHEIHQLKSDWERLSSGRFMRRPSWLLAWGEAYKEEYAYCFLVAYQGDKTIGIMPLVLTFSAWMGRTLVFAGSGKACSDDLSILCEKSDEADVSAAFANWLVGPEEDIGWEHLNLDGIREDNELMQRFAQTLVELTGCEVNLRPSPNCWKASLEGGIDAYRQRLTKRARKILKGCDAEIQSGRSQFVVANSLNDAIHFLSEISHIHQMRWQEKGIQGCFSETTFSNFLQKAIKALWIEPWSAEDTNSPEAEKQKQNRVHVAVLKIGTDTAAGAICIRERNTFCVYLTGMDPAYSDVRPGWQLLQCCIQHAIAIGCDSIDFLRGDEEYKERLGGVPSIQQRWLIASPRLSAQVRGAAYRAAVEIKSWWKAIATPQDNTTSSHEPVRH